MRVSVESGSSIGGLLNYVRDEYSFAYSVDPGERGKMFDRAGDEGPTSVLIGMLQVEVGAETGAALFAWGYHPHINWQDGHLPQPVATPGIVRFDEDFTYAVSVSVAAPMEWATTRDVSSGWLRVAPVGSPVDEALVEIATDVLLGHRDGEFAAVWLRPTVVDSLGEDDD